jgi:multidrug efflux pump
MVATFKQLPQLADVVTDQQLNGKAETLVIDRATASRFGITPQTIDNTLYDAFGQRQINTLYTQLNQYHVILEAEPKFQLDPRTLNDIYIQSTVNGSTSTTAVSNTAGSSSGAGAGASASPGNALLTPSSTSISSAASSTSALAAANTSTPLGISSVSSGSALSPASTASARTTVLSSTSTSSSISSSANTSLSGTSRSTGTSASSSSGGGGSGTSGAVVSTPVPLSAFLHFQRRSEPLSINRQGQFPAVTISFNLAPGTSLGEALEAIDKALARSNIPSSVVRNYQGTAAAFQGSLSNEGLLILAALVTVYIVLGVLYESFIHPITILSTLPSAGVGALLALELFHLDLDIVAIIGIILLIGIVKKNGIMMVDFALEAERKEGKPAAEAIYQASLLRFRPIMMTTMAALLSGIPLAFGSGIGSELRKPLGVAMVGGLLVSQVLTLYTTPVIYIFFDNLGARFSHRPSKVSNLRPETEQP